MTQAQKVDRSLASGLEVVASVPGAAAFRAGAPIDLRHIVRRPLPSAPSLAPIKPEPPARPAASDVALNLITDASAALSTLMARCQELETALEATKDQGMVEIEAANGVAREWQQIAQSLKVQVEQLEKNSAILKQRLEAAEERAADVQSQAEKSQHAAAEAECLSSLFQDKVMSSFGVGTVGHSILETVRNRTAAMLTA